MPEGYDEHSTLDGELAPSTPDNEPVRDNGLKVQPETPSVYSSSSEPYSAQTAQPQQLAKRTPPPKSPPPPPPPDDSDDEGDEEEKGMLRMSFMEHLEELRSRLIKALGGLVVAFILCIGFCKDLWLVVSAPAVIALTHLGINPPDLAQIKPMEQFNVIYIKLPLLVSLFVASPWVLYQVWAFISPGLYKKEKRWAVPFILFTAGLFITGGLFAYFVAFRYGLEFLLGIGRDVHVRPVVSIDEYFDLFVNVTLGVGLVFEMPVLIFFLTLLRLASPRFLLKHSRYAILAITIIAAVVTPTPDIFNMMLFAVPMVLLFFIGLFAAHLLVLRREGKKFPWRLVVLVVFGALIVAAGVVALFVYHYHYHFIQKWPFLVK
ncbi:MAG TPA: twin-arginine translocase subunit TatC [Bryobacteraceae bacterium]|nr:twin-arginine translocase subunit TatC [Bryobacteraceae bacterium]